MATYTFNGEADNTDLGSVSGWARVSGNALDVKLMSDGQVYFVATTDSCYRASAGAADHSHEITYGSGSPRDGGHFPCCVRVTDSNNFVGARYFSGEIQLYKRASGTFTSLGNITQAVAAGDRLKVSASGNTINVYLNDVLKIGPITESAQNTVSYAGIVGRSDATNALVTQSVITDLTASGLTITSVTPASFDDGKTGIVIAGAGFGASQGASTVDIGGQAQTITNWTDTSITFTCTRGGNSVGNAQLTLTKV